MTQGVFQRVTHFALAILLESLRTKSDAQNPHSAFSNPEIHNSPQMFYLLAVLIVLPNDNLHMRLTPIDIKKHTFNTGFRGFAPEEVEAFLDTVSRQWEELLDELDRAKRRIAELEGETRKYKDVEAMLHQTLAQAQQSTNSVIEMPSAKTTSFAKKPKSKANNSLTRQARSLRNG
jgi:DivIVA domain-containing protein